MFILQGLLAIYFHRKNIAYKEMEVGDYIQGLGICFWLSVSQPN